MAVRQVYSYILSTVLKRLLAGPKGSRLTRRAMPLKLARFHYSRHLHVQIHGVNGRWGKDDSILLRRFLDGLPPQTLPAQNLGFWPGVEGEPAFRPPTSLCAILPRMRTPPAALET